ncbi:hypothetical protein [Streptomyces sp. CBMA156]|uniref:hypothetical protein n=1 Tax=Streptomyces sp. CBMA156 TaxID=1930280 RepID=UPI0016619348|nr:hypothetical protein [Streptomyces sp. CBMA156]MBD0674663.1 hypothetical protein [Streptomyces sp. CBMA156]
MTVKVILTRDSVCMGDDCHAPHQQECTFDSATTLGDFVTRIAGYPLRMRGARWVMFLGWNHAGGSPIAEISPEWAGPRFMDGADPLLLLASLAPADGDGDLSFFFRYHSGSVPLAGSPDPDPTADRDGTARRPD